MNERDRRFDRRGAGRDTRGRGCSPNPTACMRLNWLWRGLVGVTVLASALVAWAGTLAEFRTPLGNLQVELFDDAKPVTVRNFVRYVTAGSYTNLLIHRWVPGFVIQGGGFYVEGRTGTNVIEPVAVFGAITNEFGSGPPLSNTYGTLAMARVGGQTNSATSQWFFNLAHNASLDTVDGGFTVFGRVIGGTHILTRFNNVSVSNGVFRVSLGGALNELPVLSLNPTYQDLVYVNVSLLTAHLAAAANGEKEISWVSVSNHLNQVEFTTNLPPVWRRLVSTNGTGDWMKVRDPDRSSLLKLYRVRVDF